MNPSPSDADQRDEPPNKKLRIGRRGLGALLLLLAINWTFTSAASPSAPSSP